MLETLARLVIAASIFIILFFAYAKKDKLSQHVVYVILAAVAASMALNGLASLISDVEFLSFLVDFLGLLSDLVIFVELGLILFLFIIKFKTKVMLLKVAIIVYVVLKLVIEFNVL